VLTKRANSITGSPAGTSYEKVAALNEHILDRRPQIYLDYTASYWRAWVNKNDADFDGLPAEIVDLYKRSLLIVPNADR
jgi:hypothetical protein